MLVVGDLHDFTIVPVCLQEVTKVKPVDGPVGRTIHAACCLNYDEDHPQLLVHGGLGDNRSTLGDIWILDVDTGMWTEVSVSQFLYIALGVHNSVHFH